ncbi:MAG: hypothetical protein WDZ30_06130 [Cellvibrionaceae bacterium]
MNIDFHIDEVVPHAGIMSLLDRVADYGTDWLVAEVAIGPHTLFMEEGGVPAWVGIEYMAQAVAAFAGVQRQQQGLDAAVGFLVGTRKYSSSHSFFLEGVTLRIKVEREFQADNGLGVFDCSIRGATEKSEEIAADAALNVFQPEDVQEFLNQGAASHKQQS